MSIETLHLRGSGESVPRNSDKRGDIKKAIRRAILTQSSPRENAKAFRRRSHHHSRRPPRHRRCPQC